MIRFDKYKRAIDGVVSTSMALTKPPDMEVVMANQNPTRKARFREKNNNWKGGRSVTSHGYVLIRVGIGHPLADCRGYAYEHRLKAWESGQDIAGKHIHHENEIKADNSLGNLEVLTIAEHRFRHRRSDSNRRKPGEENIILSCECGCGQTFEKFDAVGRARRFIPGHNTVIKNPLIECACGCGSRFKRFNQRGNERKYRFGHQPRRENPLVACACNCGTVFPRFDSSNRPRRYVSGHNSRSISHVKD